MLPYNNTPLPVAQHDLFTTKNLCPLLNNWQIADTLFATKKSRSLSTAEHHSIPYCPFNTTHLLSTAEHHHSTKSPQRTYLCFSETFVGCPRLAPLNSPLLNTPQFLIVHSTQLTYCSLPNTTTQLNVRKKHFCASARCLWVVQDLHLWTTQASSGTSGYTNWWFPFSRRKMTRRSPSISSIT
jgi:hypothetical protein